MVGNVAYGIGKDRLTVSGKNADVKIALGMLAAEYGDMKLVDYLKLMNESKEGRSAAGLNLIDLNFSPDLAAKLKAKNKKTLPRVNLVNKVGFAISVIIALTMVALMRIVEQLPVVASSFPLSLIVTFVFVIVIYREMLDASRRLGFDSEYREPNSELGLRKI